MIQLSVSLYEFVLTISRATTTTAMEKSIHENSKSKLRKLKAFKKTRNKLAMLGIDRKLATQTYPFNVKISKCFLLLISTLISVSVYIFNYTETFFEYTQSVYVASALVLFILALFILILKVQELFEYINRCQYILNRCE